MLRTFSFGPRRWMVASLAALLPLAGRLVVPCFGQTCTTQAKMSAATRDALSAAAMAAGKAIESNDSAGLARMAAPDLAANFSATAELARTTGQRIVGDTLRVVQLYQLDTGARSSDAHGEQDFSCALQGSASETDFAITGLGQGVYAFAMVDADGTHPWLLAMLFRQDGGAWKLAGFYPRARTAAGHDGLWYWNEARQSVKAGELWNAWLLYGEADTLLRPANFVSSTNLDKLRDERVSAAPSELKNGVSEGSPYELKAANGTVFTLTSMALDPADEGDRLNLIVHARVDALVDTEAERARNAAIAQALLAAHPELRKLVAGVTVFAEASTGLPFATTIPVGMTK